MSETVDRRAWKKAQKRQLIRTVARRMFDEHGFEAVTIADIARESDVAVQTVFNHFPTKEELFFDGRAPWIDGPAEAVRHRAPSVPPLTALRAYFVELVSDRLRSLSCPDRRRYIATLEASDALRTHERELMHQSEQQLRAALLDAWADDESAPDDPEASALLVAALWVATGRALIVERRPQVTGDGADPDQTAEAATALADRVLRSLERSASALPPSGGAASEVPPADADTGWPQFERQAG